MSGPDHGQIVGLPLPADERYVNRKQLAELLGVSVSTVDRFVRAGMPSDRWGPRMRRFLPSRCVAWLRERQYAPGSTQPIAPAPALTGRGHGPQEAVPVSTRQTSAVPTKGQRP